MLFFESLSTVRTQRAEDYELLEVCERGEARGSSKMREACLRARADLASPIVFKAVVHAVRIAFDEFRDAVGSPLRAAVVLLFALSSFAAPINGWLRALRALPALAFPWIRDDMGETQDLHRDEDEDARLITYVGIADDDDIVTSPRRSRFGMARSWKRAARAIRRQYGNSSRSTDVRALDLEPGDRDDCSSEWKTLLLRDDA